MTKRPVGRTAGKPVHAAAVERSFGRGVPTEVLLLADGGQRLFALSPIRAARPVLLERTGVPYRMVPCGLKGCVSPFGGGMVNDMSNLCDMCGACCRTFPVLVSIGDAKREPRIKDEALKLEQWQRTEDWEYRLHPLPFNRGCAFLSGDDRCSVYETRPAVCRKFEAGSEECLEARRRAGLLPL